MADIKFVDGFIPKPPHEKAPDFVKFNVAIHREHLIKWLQEQEGEWINCQVKESKKGSWYAAVDEFKPDPNYKKENKEITNAPSEGDEDLAF